MIKETAKMQHQLAGQVALITGGGRGLGRAFALALAQTEALVAVTARTRSELDETVRLIEQNGGRALAVPADVTDRQAVATIVDTVTARFGAIDLLINNAGIVTPLGPLWEIDPDEWWRSMEINLRSVLLCSSAVLPGDVLAVSSSLSSPVRRTRSGLSITTISSLPIENLDS
jgi:NAD(P)-dependent dehydrogenase (short-subunit alcohol dehydrogenase family)